ncbi:MAG: AAA family ATPase [Microthrixaceae bacterium]
MGSFDPSAVLTEGYVPEVFVDGPLVTALREGSILYLEELNRVPEETLNVLITVMSEGEIHVRAWAGSQRIASSGSWRR